MILYILYNADLLEIVIDEKTEHSLGYVDDIALIATGKDLDESTKKTEKDDGKGRRRIRVEQRPQL
jgi:hypothetical protein